MGGRGSSWTVGGMSAFICFLFFNVLLARQLLGLEKALEVHLLIGRALISRTHAALTTAAPFEVVGGKPETFGEFCR